MPPNFEEMESLLDVFLRMSGAKFGSERNLKALKATDPIRDAHFLVENQETGNQGSGNFLQVELKKKPSYLPDEIWLKIFSYLDVLNLYRNVSLVTKHFHELSMDSDATKHLLIKVFNMSQNTFDNYMKLLEGLQSLKTVTLETYSKNNKNMNILCMKALESCPNLKELKMIHYQNGMEKLEVWTRKMESVTIKNISNLDKTGFDLNMKFLKQSNCLKTVVIETEKGPNGNGYHYLNMLAIQALQHCTNLSTLELKYYKTRETRNDSEPWLLSRTMKMVKEKVSLRKLVLKNLRLKESPDLFQDQPELKVTILDVLDESYQIDSANIPKPAFLQPVEYQLANPQNDIPQPEPIPAVSTKKSTGTNLNYRVKSDGKLSFLITKDGSSHNSHLLKMDIAKLFNGQPVDELEIIGREITLQDLGTFHQIPMKKLILKDLRMHSQYLRERLVTNLNKTNLEYLVVKILKQVEYESARRMKICLG